MAHPFGFDYGLTLAAGTSYSLTGGGTLALGGYTLTVPATGTAALLGAANTFTAAQTITNTMTDNTQSLTINHTLNNSTLISSGPSVYTIAFVDTSSANRLAAQLFRFSYTRNSGTTGVPTAGWDTLITLGRPTMNESMAAEIYSLLINGPSVASGKTLNLWYGIRIGGPTGTGTTSALSAIMTEPGANSVLIGTATDGMTAGGSLAIAQDLAHRGSKAGFFNVTPATRPTAYTQTYSTASKTVANPTSATLTDNTGGTADTTLAAVEATYTQATIRNNFADLAAMVNKLTADVLADKKVITQIIDDLQSLGLLQ